MSGAELIAVLGITSNVLQIADACSKILDRIQAFRQNLAFQDLVVQLPLLINVVKGLDTPKYRELLDESTKHALSRVLQGCLRQLRRLETLIQSMSAHEAASKFEKTWKGIRSFGKDTKLREILGALTEYKSTITLHLSSVHVHNFQKAKPTSGFAKSYFDVPSSRLSHFVGRSNVFSQIQRTIDSSAVSPTVIVLTGAGGQGKTQVALEFCHRNTTTYSGIFWIDSSSEVAAIRSYEKVLRLLNGETLPEKPHDTKGAVKDLLRSWEKPWLLVFDNFDDPNSFQGLPSFFPQSNGANKNAILVTSRHVLSARLGAAIPLTGLSEEEGLELLLSRSATLSRTDSAARESKEGRMIVMKLGYLALAIDQAAAYISIRQLPLSMFMEHFEKRKEFILEATPQSLWEYRTHTSDESGNGSRNLSVLTTWEMSFDQISESHEARTQIGDFLTQAAFFDPGAITETLFSNFHEHADGATMLWKPAFETNGAWDTFQFQDVVVGLANLSLVQGLNINSDGVAFSLHPLIKEWLQLRRNLDSRQRRTSTAIAMTSSLILSLDNERLSFGNRQELLAHIDACTENCAHHLTSEESQVTYGGFVEGFQTNLATFLGEHDRYKDAETLFVKALSIQQQKLGLENIATLSTLNNLGALYLGARQLEKAKPNLELALQIKENMLGPDHPRTLNSVNNIGNLFALQMSYDEATRMFQRTLEGYSKINGPMHKTVFESLNNIGEVAMKKGDLQEAERMFKTAFTKARTVSGGKDDSLVLYVASNIALVYKLQHRYQEALQTYSDVVTGRERLLGAEHSSTLQSMCEVADVYTVLGDEKSASHWYQKGNASSERKERGKLGSNNHVQPKLIISRSTDSPPEKSTSRSPAESVPVPLPPRSSGTNDDILPVVHRDDQMEWEASPQSRLPMASDPSLATDSGNLKSYSEPIDRIGAGSYQRYSPSSSNIPAKQYAHPSDNIWNMSLRELFADRGGLYVSNLYSPGMEIDPTPQIDRGGHGFSQLWQKPETPWIDRVGQMAPQQATTIPRGSSIDPPAVPSVLADWQNIDRTGMGLSNWNPGPPAWRQSQLPVFAPSTADSNQIQRNTSIDRAGRSVFNFPSTAHMDNQDPRTGWSSRLNPAFTGNTRPRSECEYIERGGVCMHNVNHMR